MLLRRAATILPDLSWRFADEQVRDFLGVALSRVLEATAQALDATDELPDALVQAAVELARHAVDHGSDYLDGPLPSAGGHGHAGEGETGGLR